MPPLEPASELAVLITFTTILFVPTTVYVGIDVVPEHTTSAFPPAQSRTLPLLTAIVRVALTPAAGIRIVAKSSVPVAVSVSGFTIFAVAVAGVVAPTAAAWAGVEASVRAATEAASVIRSMFFISNTPLGPNLAAGRPRSAHPCPSH